MRFRYAAAVLLAACQPTAAPPAEAPPAPAAIAQIHEDAPVFDGNFLAVSKTAESITGNISFDAGVIRFDLGHVYETAPVKLVEGADSEAAAKLFSLGDRADMKYELRRVTNESVNAQAPNGGLCKPEATTFILLGGAYAPEVGSTAVFIAAYTGKDEPGPSAKDSKLCGTYMYERGP